MKHDDFNVIFPRYDTYVSGSTIYIDKFFSSANNINGNNGTTIYLVKANKTSTDKVLTAFFTTTPKVAYLPKEDLFITKGIIVDSLTLNIVAQVVNKHKKQYFIKLREYQYYRNSCLALYIDKKYVADKKYSKIMNYLLSLSKYVDTYIVSQDKLQLVINESK
jgi:hypothetical protein